MLHVAAGLDLHDMSCFDSWIVTYCVCMASQLLSLVKSIHASACLSLAHRRVRDKLCNCCCILIYGQVDATCHRKALSSPPPVATVAGNLGFQATVYTGPAIDESANA